MTVTDRLYEKMSAEYDAFIENLKGTPPNKIIESAHEKVFKEDILACFEYNDSFADNQIAALLALERPLESLYHNWLDTDVSYMDDLRDTITNYVTQVLGEPKSIDSAEMEIPDSPETRKAQAINGDICPGDWVISAGNSDYGYLLGTVTTIDKLGTPEHDTENDTDDIHVDFTAFDYPPERISEIEETFSDLYGEPKTFDELPLDDVIMAPGELISISNLSFDEITRMGNLRQNCEAFCNCFPGAMAPLSNLHAELMARVEKSFADYHNSLVGFDARELIDMAGKIAAWSDAYDYMTMYRGFEDKELEFYLKLQNPLEVVADEWYERRSDLEDMGFAFDYISNRMDEILEDYPLMPEKPAEPLVPELPEKPPSDKKRSIGDRLAAGNEKVKAYKEQKAQNPENTPKHKKEDIL